MTKTKKIIGIISIIAVVFSSLLLLFHPIYIQETGLGNGSSAIWDRELQQFTDNLVHDCKSEQEKVAVIYQWVIENIEYDNDYRFGIYQSVNLRQVMNERKTVCYGYANLFAAMCRSQNIPCVIVDGTEKDNKNAAHSWNRVCIDGVWYEVDTTNDATQYRHNKPLYGFHSINSKDCESGEYNIVKIY